MSHETYLARKQARLCVACGVSCPWSTRCPPCAEKAVARALNWRRRQKMKGMCVVCGKKAVNALHCETHRQKHNVRVQRSAKDLGKWRLGVATPFRRSS